VAVLLAIFTQSNLIVVEERLSIST